MSQSESLRQSSEAVVGREGHVEIILSTTQSYTSPKPPTTTRSLLKIPSYDKIPPEQPSHVPLQFPENAEHIPNSMVRIISAPYMLQRFLTIEVKNEPLQFEANLGIFEGKLHEGQDMLCKKMVEEGWEEVDGDWKSVTSSQECRAWSVGGESGEGSEQEFGDQSSANGSVGCVSNGLSTGALSVHLESRFNSPYIEDQLEG